METRKIDINLVVPNDGQIAGLPNNPRQWTRGELDKLKASIAETPELFEARGLLVYPFGDEYIVMGGNMRLSASRALGLQEVPCIILPEDMPVEKLREIVIKDNGAFGEWDYDLLANEWDDLPLSDWGVPAWNTSTDEDYGTEFSLPDGERKTNQITFYLSADQKAFVEDMLERVEVDKNDCGDNQNRNGNKIYSIVKQWAEQRIS